MSDNHDQSLSIRPAGRADRDALRRLAERDTALVPPGEVLVALVDGEIRAALSVETREGISDPFYPTAELMEILLARAAQIDGPVRRGIRSLAGGLLRGRRHPEAALSPQPAGTLRASGEQRPTWEETVG